MSTSVGGSLSGPFTLEIKEVEGTYRGDSLQLGAYALHVLDGSRRELHNVRLRTPIQIRFHFGPMDLSGLNGQDIRLVWPATANEKAGKSALSVPLTLDTQAHTLTATVSTVDSGTMVLTASVSDANAASSEHPLVSGNTGDLSFSMPLTAPTAAGRVAPDMTFAYSSGGPNGRDRWSPAPWAGDGWDMSFGSISYDAVTGFFYLNGISGVNEMLICCVVDSTHGNINYFMPHHHNYLHVTTSDNSTHPNTTGSSFTVRTLDGTEYDFGATTDSQRSTVTSGVRTYYEWDLSQVIRRGGVNAGYLQRYTVSYWQDLATSGGITYVRDAAPREIDYDFVNGHAQNVITFNIHWPGANTTIGSAVATSYGTNYNCGTSPLVATTLRCDDPVQVSGWEAPPLTMSTITLDQATMVMWNGSAWQTVRAYGFQYAGDSAGTTCWDDVTGIQFVCAGEHVLTSIQEIPYQGGAAEPSHQPIAFTYTGKMKDEYNDYTKTGSGGLSFNAQRWWQYLSSFTDKQTGASATIAWKTAYGNSHGVPSGYNVLDPWACGTASCYEPDDRQWEHQTVASITDVGLNTTTTYTYRLNTPCGSGCTEFTWIAPNGFNACKGNGQPPSNPMPSCLITGPYTNYYNELYTGFVQVYIAHPTGATDYTQYYAGGGWGGNDFNPPQVYDGYPLVEDTYPGAATGAPLREVDHTYLNSNCPSVQSNGNQLIVNNYMLCNAWETQRDTYTGGTSASPGVPHLTQQWAYDGGVAPTLGMQYHALDMITTTTNDAISDSVTNYGSTQPSFYRNYQYAIHDGTLDSPTTPYYLADLMAHTWLDDNLGNRWSCQQVSYDGQAYVTGQTSTITDGLPTRADAWANCGTSGNNYTTSGGVTAGFGYDVYGQQTVTTDADALAGVSGHTGCSAPATLATVYPTGAATYSQCVAYDTLQEVYPIGSWNAAFQQSGAAYDVTQGVMTSSVDANNVATTYGGPIYEYSGTPSLSTFQDVYTQTTLPGETYGGSSPWTTRVFAYSFCAGSTSATSPCLEVDTVRQYDATDTLVSRVFYDRDGRQVETRATSPVLGQDTVTITAYNDTAHSSWTSLPCTVAALSTGNGGRTVASTPNYIAPTQTSGGSSAYIDPNVSGSSCSSGTLTGATTWLDAMSRTVASDDPLGTGVGASGSGCILPGGATHHTTCAVYTPVVASATPGLPSSDTEPYLQSLTIDANLHQRATYTDALGRDAYAQELSGASQQAFGAGVTSYAVTADKYDPTGALRQVTDPQGHVTSFTRDTLGRQTAMSDPNRGAESYAYDPNGNVTQTVDARGASGTIYAGYDRLNRQSWRNTTNSATGAYVTYSYDSVAGGNLGTGRLTGETFSNANAGGSLSGSYTYTYDGRGRITATTETVGATPYTTSASYNDADQLTQQTYPNGDILTTAYTPSTGQPSGLSVQLSGAPSATWLLSNETYSGQAGAAGLLTSATLGAFTSGAGAYTASYDGLLRLSSAQDTYTPSGGSATTLYQVQPTYDALGNVTSVTTTLPQGVDTQVFCYDAQNRLTWAGSSGAPGCASSLTPSDTGGLAGTGASYAASYSYDTLNRLTLAPLGAEAYADNAHVDAATAIGSNWTAAYDAAGNMTCRSASGATTCLGTPTGNTLSYDNQGQLAAWQTTPSNPTATDSFLYDGAGQRVEQIVSTSATTTTTTSVGSLEEVATTGSTTTTTATYGRLALSVNGTLSYTLSDGLGSVSEAVATSGASAGSVSATQLYAPYGAVRFQSGTLSGTRGYTGQHADAATGLDYYGARYYDPLAGQFTSADTTLAGGLNRYTYVGGNPTTYIDPSGHEEWVGAEGEGAALSGGKVGSNEGPQGDSGGGAAGDGEASATSGEVTTVANVSHPGEVEQTYGIGDGAVSFELDAEGHVVGVVDEAGRVDTSAELDAQTAANESDQLRQGDHGPSENVQRSGETVKTKTNLVRAANQARNPDAKGPTYGQVTIENPESGEVVDQSGVYTGVGKAGTSNHAEVQGTSYARDAISGMNPTSNSRVRVTIAVGNPFCSGCSAATLGGYASQIQAAAPEGIQVEVAFFSWSFLGGQYLFFGAP